MSDQNGEQTRLKIYELYLDDLGRIGSRHETARQFYLTVLSAIIAFLALAGKDGPLTTLAPSIRIIGGVTGVLVCVLWLLHMRSFAQLYVIKFSILDDMEQTLPLRPFTDERARANSTRRHHLTNIDSAAAVVFLLLFLAISLVGYAT